VKPSQTHKAQR